MQLKFFRHLWGIDMPWEQAFPRIISLGYTGIETVLPPAADEAQLADLLAAHQLELIITAQTRGGSVGEHIESLRQQANRAKKLKCRFVAAQAGRDAFDAAETRAFYAEALKIEAEAGIDIAHETHRGRPLFHPWAATAIVNQFPSLKLVCDFSHWVCVCERLIDDCLPMIRRVADQAYHIHARVGYAQGPQVPDPRAMAYQPEVQAHERWWDLLWDRQQERGFAESTMCPEFGPPQYLQTDPQSGKPVANLWEIVNWQHDRQRARFARRFG
jgi:sugar phosphate isomerase/epimerase